MNLHLTSPSLKKLKKLKDTDLANNMGKADSLIRPFSVETTGGIGKHGIDIITALSRVAIIIVIINSQFAVFSKSSYHQKCVRHHPIYTPSR